MRLLNTAFLHLVRYLLFYWAVSLLCKPVHPHSQFCIRDLVHHWIYMFAWIQPVKVLNQKPFTLSVNDGSWCTRAVERFTLERESRNNWGHHVGMSLSVCCPHLPLDLHLPAPNVTVGGIPNFTSCFLKLWMFSRYRQSRYFRKVFSITKEPDWSCEKHWFAIGNYSNSESVLSSLEIVSAPVCKTII